MTPLVPKEHIMTDTHLTAPTRFVEVKGDRFAYRRWGSGDPDSLRCSSFSISVAAWIIGTRSRPMGWRRAVK